MTDAAETDSRGRGKSATAFRTISEVSADLDVPQHVLRFWETKFPQIKPLKRGGGRRYYRPDDVDLLRRIQRLLYKEGYTIKGVQRLLKESRGGLPDAARPDTPGAQGAPAAPPAAPTPEPARGHGLFDGLEEDDEGEGPVELTPATRHRLQQVLEDLLELRRLLKNP